MSYLQQRFLDCVAVDSHRHTVMHGVLTYPPGCDERYREPARVQQEIVDAGNDVTWVEIMSWAMFHLFAADTPQEREPWLRQVAVLAAKWSQDDAVRAGRSLVG